MSTENTREGVNHALSDGQEQGRLKRRNTSKSSAGLLHTALYSYTTCDSAMQSQGETMRLS